jgi:toxin ParE1/3/4
MIWTPAAEADLDRLVRYICENDVDAAFRTEDRIMAAVLRLDAYPASGRNGRWGDTRELVVARTAYVVVYRLKGDFIEILRILHGAQDWPPT